LHDIGKLVQRAQKNPREMDHCKWGDKWFEEKLAEKLTMFSPSEKEIVRRAINTHHDHMDFISLADALSAGMDRIELLKEENDPFTSRLKCIFSEISVSQSKPTMYFYPLKPLSEKLDGIFPEKGEKCTYQDYSHLLSEFEEEILKIFTQKVTPLELINLFYFTLWKFTWSVPSAAYKDEPDISLFDHLKTTSAITACLYLYRKENNINYLTADSPAFILLMGDVSGIQSYIFDVLSQQGKVAKRLRARSLFVQLLSEVSSHKTIHKFGLPYLNIISSAGGNFCVLLPNLKEAKEKIKEIQEELDNWSYQRGWSKMSEVSFFEGERRLGRS
jgi:CRISPR-associated protein Csm1